MLTSCEVTGFTIIGLAISLVQGLTGASHLHAHDSGGADTSNRMDFIRNGVKVLPWVYTRAYRSKTRIGTLRRVPTAFVLGALGAPTAFILRTVFRLLQQ